MPTCCGVPSPAYPTRSCPGVTARVSDEFNSRLHGNAGMDLHDQWHPIETRDSSQVGCKVEGKPGEKRGVDRIDRAAEQQRQSI